MTTATSLILGIETSCDETAAAVVHGGTTVLSSVIASQHDLHEEFQGVVPEIASRAHAERILPVVRAAVAEAGVAMRDLTGIAVGNRPGLIGSLLVGVGAAKALAWSLGVPLVGVDHVQAHLYAGLMNAAAAPAVPAVEFPALGLVVSGGHTSLFLMQSPVDVAIVGATIDDAIGEAYDKVASMLGLGFPGGPAVDRLAQAGDARRFSLPVSTLGRESLDFSFSGLKTAVRYAAFGVPKRDEIARVAHDRLSEVDRRDLCAAFQHAAIRAVETKIGRAFTRFPQVRTLLIGGGVSANSLLRERMSCLVGQVRVVLPSVGLSLDNGAMIAGLGTQLLESGCAGTLSLGAFPNSSIPQIQEYSS